jgi:hypothetical protein
MPAEQAERVKESALECTEQAAEQGSTAALTPPQGLPKESGLTMSAAQAFHAGIAANAAREGMGPVGLVMYPKVSHSIM